ncbi:hypothetical protein PybrP1_004117, partial [[Pythium] brassicae (nom. inval.)]
MRPLAPQARNPIHHAPASATLPLSGNALPATAAERRVMKKDEEAEPAPVKRNPPILGYKGYLRNAEDRVGTTFTNGLQTALRAPEPAEKLLQAIKRSFEKREAENGGSMTKEHLQEALQSLACVFTDDQVTALFGLYDEHCN